MSLRIGLSLGDVIEENGTLFGDAVNVAARLQSLAAPGAILISGAVYEQVKRKLPARLSYMGTRHVKNITDPVTTYEVVDAGVRQPVLREYLWRFRRSRAAAVTVLVILTAGTTWWLWRSGIISMQPPSDLAATGGTPAIAVLPFADLSDDHSNAPFCDGLTEELLNSLAQLPTLRVVARTSVFMFRDAARDVREIGRQLGVTHVLEGSVRRSGERVRITAHLANARTGYHEWSDDFEQPFTDSLDIQQEIAQAVVKAMQVRLTPEDEVKLTEPRAHDVRAYESYLLGRYHQYQRTPESLAKAIEYQQEAIERDPQFALAFAGLADAHMAEYYYTNRAIEDVEASMLPFIDRALAINPRLPEAYAARGTLHTEQWRLEQAQADLMRTVALNPNSADGYVRLAAALEYDGRPRAALENLRRAVELDPLHLVLHIRVCLVHQNLGQYPEAAQACNRALELRPDLPNAHWGAGLLALSQGDLAGAAQSYRDALERAPERVDLLTELAWVYMDSGQLDAAHARFDRAIDAAPSDQPFARIQKGFWHVANRHDDALLKYVSGLSTEGDFDTRLDLALLYILAGDLQRARQLADQALNHSTVTPQVLKNPYRIRWGRSSQLTLALVAMRSGNSADAEQRLTTLMQHLDDLEREGHVWHGLEYLRASVFALRGDSSAALAALERAYKLGWRRAWWMRADPSFARLQREPAFQALIARIERDAARELHTSREELRQRPTISLTRMRSATGQTRVTVRPPIPSAPKSDDQVSPARIGHASVRLPVVTISPAANGGNCG